MRLCHLREDRFFGQSMTLSCLACCSIRNQKLAGTDSLAAVADRLAGSVRSVKLVAAFILLQFYS